MPWRYVGSSPATYPSYIDAATGSTLVAEPGEVYDMRPAEGTDYVIPPAKEGGESTTGHLPVPPGGTAWEAVAPPANRSAKTPPGESGE